MAKSVGDYRQAFDSLESFVVNPSAFQSGTRMSGEFPPVIFSFQVGQLPAGNASGCARTGVRGSGGLEGVRWLDGEAGASAKDGRARVHGRGGGEFRIARTSGPKRRGRLPAQRLKKRLSYRIPRPFWTVSYRSPSTRGDWLAFGLITGTSGRISFLGWIGGPRAVCFEQGRKRRPLLAV